MAREINRSGARSRATTKRGQSKVTWDGPAPNAHPGPKVSGRGHTDCRVRNEPQPSLCAASDEGNLP
jgi:hypothetical protein